MSEIDIFTKMDNVVSGLIKLIQSENFLDGMYTDSKSIIINDTEDAITFATDQDVDYVKGKEYQYWTHILEMQGDGAYLHDFELELPQDIYEKYQDKRSQSYEKINKVLFETADNKEIDEDLQNCLSGEFFYLFKYLVFVDTLPGFWENILNILKEGGMPCGWKGNYPEGQMIVYNHKN